MTRTIHRSARAGLLWLLAFSPAALADDARPDADPSDEPVSYHAQIRPILRANCQGCHQPAKSLGGYEMTDFARLVAGGESTLAAVVPGKPEESHLLEQITPDADGEALMPKDKPALKAADVELVRRWIAQGAVDDSPAVARARYDMDHPPAYARPPVVPALDYAPDGSILAVAGFHEVLLWSPDGSELIGRLVGLSERIESVRFSPDGSKLAVTAGLPGRLGEVQVWDVAKRKLLLSVPVTFDTVYGASWSPDGTRIAFGCGDNSVRAIDAATGEQVLFMGGHNDWALDTEFSVDGGHLISVGRDMTAKLTEVATQRFVDNITSITPGALKGGIGALARHPKRDEIVVGGSDGQPRVYRIIRQTARVIGDDSNLIRELPAMPGRVNSVAVSADGTRIAAGSSLDGTGKVNIYSYEFDTALPEDIKQIMAKVAGSRSKEEQETLAKYHSQGVKLVASADLDRTAVHAVAFRPDGKHVAAAGSDGVVRLVDAATGAIAGEFVAAPITAEAASAVAAAPGTMAAPHLDEEAEAETLPEGVSLEALEVRPAEIRLAGPFAYTQLVVTGRTAAGDSIDLTRAVEASFSAEVARFDRSGLVRPVSDGKATLTLSLAGQSAEVPVEVVGAAEVAKVDYVRDVTAVLSKLGCNAGTCHGSAAGKNGFKLSLRGYDPIFDVRALTDDHAARRINPASPDDSLMLLKPTGAVPHVGGTLMDRGEPSYEVLRRWVADGAKLDLASPKVASIEVFPVNPIVQNIGAKQQIRVVATYRDGSQRDVTREAFLESGNNEVATANRSGLLTSLRRGEAPILVRYEGAYAATTLTVMGDRSGFVWEQPPAYNRVDELTAAKWERLKIRPSGLATDAEYLRRVYLDLTGLPPTPEQVRAFLADPADGRAKREAVVEQLIGSPEFVDYWTNKWADLLQVNRKFLEVEGAAAFRTWIRDQVERNVPYDQFVRSILTAEGSNRENPAAAYFKILRDPAATMENTTQLFLAVRFNCNKCHDHPFERWTQDQYYETAAYFARVGLKADPESKGKQIGATAVESGKPLYEVVFDQPEGEITHERTREVAPPQFPFACDYESAEDASRREELAAWITSSDNPYFARSYVNRLWGYLFGVGIIEPIDDIRAGNPPSNPELLDYLTEEFIASGFDMRHILKLIARSRTYQLSIASNEWNEDDRTNYSHAIARRLPAEVLLDAVYRVTGSQSNFPGVAPGTRASALPDSGVELPSGFLNTFGRPPRESACECERTSGLQLGPVMALVSGPTLADAIADPDNAIAKLVGREADDARLIDELFVQILNRPATAEEIEACRAEVGAVEADHVRLAQDLGRREVEFALKRPQLEREREANIRAAEAALAAHEAEAAPKRAEAERQRAEGIARAEAELKAFEADALPGRLADWEKEQSTAVRWLPLVPKSVKDPSKAEFRVEPDGTVVVEGSDEPGDIEFVAETDLEGITGFRLEMIADPKLPSGGPGRAGDGNFVLNQFKIEAAPKDGPEDSKPVGVKDPKADFEQQNFSIAAAVDGSPNGGKGWAVSPAAGVTHWATFEAAEPVGNAGGTVLTFRLVHRYRKGYMPGRFRISVTRVPQPIGLGLAEEFRAILAVAPELRTPAQREALLAYRRAVDPEARKHASAVAEARKPLPEDARKKELAEQLEFARRPVEVDPILAQLRQDLDQSVRQAAARRLTAAQDITWALINSPAFLFNH